MTATPERGWELTDRPEVILFATVEGTLTFSPNRIEVRDATGTVVEKLAPETERGHAILAQLHARELASLHAKKNGRNAGVVSTGDAARDVWHSGSEVEDR